MVAVKTVPPSSVSNSWPQPNFMNPKTRGPALLIVSVILTLIMVIVVGLRSYVRLFVLRAPGWDDYFIWIATFGAMALCVTVNVSQEVGWDRHMWDQQPQWFESSELVTWIVQLLFMVIMTFTKLSALVTYLRIATGTKYRRFVWVTIGIIALWGIGFTFAAIFGCWPVHLYWTSHDGKGCTDESIRLLLATVINIFTDFLVVLMPIPIIIKLQIPRREKIVLAVLMSLGVIASIASIVRTVLMAHELDTYDVTWIGYLIWIWTIVESDLAIICISIPVLRTIAKRFFPQWTKTFHTSSGSKQPTANSSAARRGDHPISFTSLIGDGGSKLASHSDREDRSMDNMELQSTTREQYWRAAQRDRAFDHRV